MFSFEERFSSHALLAKSRWLRDLRARLLQLNLGATSTQLDFEHRLLCMLLALARNPLHTQYQPPSTKQPLGRLALSPGRDDNLPGECDKCCRASVIGPVGRASSQQSFYGLVNGSCDVICVCNGLCYGPTNQHPTHTRIHTLNGHILHSEGTTPGTGSPECVRLGRRSWLL